MEKGMVGRTADDYIISLNINMNSEHNESGKQKKVKKK